MKYEYKTVRVARTATGFLAVMEDVPKIISEKAADGWEHYFSSYVAGPGSDVAILHFRRRLADYTIPADLHQDVEMRLGQELLGPDGVPSWSTLSATTIAELETQAEDIAKPILDLVRMAVGPETADSEQERMEGEYVHQRLRAIIKERI